MVIYDISLFKGKLQKKPLHISHLLKYIAFVFLEAFLVAASQSGGHFLIAVSEKIIPENTNTQIQDTNTNTRIQNTNTNRQIQKHEYKHLNYKFTNVPDGHFLIDNSIKL